MSPAYPPSSSPLPDHQQHDFGSLGNAQHRALFMVMNATAPLSDRMAHHAPLAFVPALRCELGTLGAQLYEGAYGELLTGFLADGFGVFMLRCLRRALVRRRGCVGG